ncbi:MAG: hypothetical protein ABW185_20025 [Sedimenticola sp.]
MRKSVLIPYAKYQRLIRRNVGLTTPIHADGGEIHDVTSKRTKRQTVTERPASREWETNGDTFKRSKGQSVPERPASREGEINDVTFKSSKRRPVTNRPASKEGEINVDKFPKRQTSVNRSASKLQFPPGRPRKIGGAGSKREKKSKTLQWISL